MFGLNKAECSGSSSDNSFLTELLIEITQLTFVVSGNTHYPYKSTRSDLITQALTDVRSTGAEIKYLCCIYAGRFLHNWDHVGFISCYRVSKTLPPNSQIPGNLLLLLAFQKWTTSCRDRNHVLHQAFQVVE